LVFHVFFFLFFSFFFFSKCGVMIFDPMIEHGCQDLLRKKIKKIDYWINLLYNSFLFLYFSWCCCV
jgi:hypothetical protein